MPITAFAAPQPGTPGDGGIVEKHTTLAEFGTGQLRGDCPFCRSPMLRLRPGYNTFHCWHCGTAGDARTFV